MANLQSTTVTGTLTATSSNVENLNGSSGSFQFWQGSLTEFNAISASANDNEIYFVIE